jgi:hypothetical protein
VAGGGRGRLFRTVATFISTRTQRNIHILFRLLLLVDSNSRLPVSTESEPITQTHRKPTRIVCKGATEALVLYVGKFFAVMVYEGDVERG